MEYKSNFYIIQSLYFYLLLKLQSLISFQASSTYDFEWRSFIIEFIERQKILKKYNQVLINMAAFEFLAER